MSYLGTTGTPLAGVRYLRREPKLRDGDVVAVGDTVLIGTCPLSWAEATARRIVRGGLADILRQLGEPVQLPTGDELWDDLMARR